VTKNNAVPRLELFDTHVDFFTVRFAVRSHQLRPRCPDAFVHVSESPSTPCTNTTSFVGFCDESGRELESRSGTGLIRHKRATSQTNK